VSEQTQPPPVVDPDNVPEILCDGQFNVTVTGNLATLTFTHVRPDPAPLLRDGTLTPVSVVRARIVITLHNLAALQGLLNQVIKQPDAPAPPAGGPTRH
jgi:hypothetical protein